MGFGNLTFAGGRDTIIHSISSIIGYFADSLAAILLAQLLHAATFGTFHAAAIHLVHHYFRGRHEGRGQALYSSVSFGAGGAVGSLIAGYAWAALGPSITFGTAGAVAALGAFVGERAAAMPHGRTVAFAVIHASTSGEHAYADCWYPGPAAEDCPCFDEERADRDPDWLQSMRAHRERPDLPQRLPTDVDYGEPVQLCLGDAVRLDKPQAIDAFATQLGTIGIAPGVLPPEREGLLDCSAYLRSFGRRTEVFVVREFPGPGGT